MLKTDLLHVLQDKKLDRRKFLNSCGTVAGMLAFAPKVCSASDAKATKVEILVTTDIHGRIMDWDYLTASAADVGLAKIFTLIKGERKKTPNTILIDNGDILQGTPLVTYYNTIDKDWKNHPMIEVYNAMQYDAIILGNHEFNFGLDLLKRVIGSSKSPVLSANTVDAKREKTWSAVKAYSVKKLKINDETIKVGIIGLTTNAIPNWEDTSHYAGLQFKDQLEVAKSIIKEIKDKVDLIIISSHSGVEILGEESIQGENQIAAIANACPEVSLIIAGHNHITIDNSNPIMNSKKEVLYPKGIINGKPILESNCWGKFLGKAELSIAKIAGKWQVTDLATSNLSTKGVAADPGIVAITKPYHDTTIKYLNTKIGTAAADFDSIDGTLKETSLVNLVNDVQRYYGEAMLSTAAVFNLKAVINTGAIRLQDIYSLYIYENFMYTIKITAAQLKQYLEHSAKYYKQFMPGDSSIGINNNGIRDYNYDMVQGIDYVIDITKPEGQRIKNLVYNGQSVQDSAIFTCALNNYRFNGGGGFMAAMGFDLTNKPEVIFDSMKAYGDDGQVRNLISKYIQDKGAISPVVKNSWTVSTVPID
jgi:2',3'-cyclic-nucleotide 2'-phosphodiesterase (5'-nucleotidase family)